MNSFCTNCGKESNKKVCPHCGVKRNTTHQFCSWCGSPISENAVICTSCKENVNGADVSILFKIIRVLGLIALFFAMVMSFLTSAYLSGVFFAFAIIFLLPFVKNIVITATHNKQTIRKPLNVIRIFLVIVLAVIGMATQPETEYAVISENATSAAEVVFHENVALKNEESFVINDSDVTYSTTPYNGKEKFRLVTVVMDYSAQNGFGGMSREDYTIQILFNVENGEYYRLDGTLID